MPVVSLRIAYIEQQLFFTGPTKHRKGLKNRKDGKGPHIDVLNTAKTNKGLEIIS